MLQQSTVRDEESGTRATRNLFCVRLRREVAQELIEGNVIVFVEGIDVSQEIDPNCPLPDYLMDSEVGITQEERQRISSTPTSFPMDIPDPVKVKLQQDQQDRDHPYL